MKCTECNLWWPDRAGEYPHCHADPNWPAPCEYEDEWDEEEEDDWSILDCSDEPSFPEGELRIGKKWNCAECVHSGQETTDDVACCNCCENGSFFEEYKDEYTLADLGNNWW